METSDSGLILPGRGIIVPTPGEVQRFLLKGLYGFDHYDRHGTLKGRYEIRNQITNQGKNYLLNAGFNGGAQIAAASWYIGLIDNGTGTNVYSVTDNFGTGGHPGWLENVNYSGNRPAWGQATTSTQTLNNASAATFTINATGILAGILITSVATGGVGTDILWSTAAFATAVPVASTDVMKASYTLAC